MDSLSLSAKLLSVLALAQNSAKLISAATRLQDPKLDQIHYRLLAEKKRTAEWASHMRVLKSTNPRATISPEEHDAVVVLLGKLDTYYRKAHEKFSAIENPTKGPVDPTALKARTKSLLDGYDDLKELVDTLAAMNDTLKSSAPSLPKCSPRAYRDRSPIQLSSPMTMDEVSLAAKPSPASATAQNIDEATGVYEPTTLPSVHSIYQTTLDTLISLSIRRRNPQVTRSASRLKLWGTGLFKMGIPLDEVFESDKDSNRPVRDCILKILVEILVWEEQELNILAREADNEERVRDQHSAQATTALLESDELIDFALESWRNWLEGQASAFAYMTGGAFVPDLVEILFDLVPALRAARQTYCIRLAESSAHAETMAGGLADASTAAAVVSSDNVERKLDVFGETLGKRDQIPTKREKAARLYSRIFRRVKDV